jgi:GGDEF domain-containing protein
VKARQRLRHAAFHDGTTGLPNQALLLDRSSIFGPPERPSEQHAGFLDLDNFKLINDSPVTSSATSSW